MENGRRAGQIFGAEKREMISRFFLLLSTCFEQALQLCHYFLFISLISDS